MLTASNNCTEKEGEPDNYCNNKRKKDNPQKGTFHKGIKIHLASSSLYTLRVHYYEQEFECMVPDFRSLSTGKTIFA
jgi:hypothetical protein